MIYFMVFKFIPRCKVRSVGAQLTDMVCAWLPKVLSLGWCRREHANTSFTPAVTSGFSAVVKQSSLRRKPSFAEYAYIISVLYNEVPSWSHGECDKPSVSWINVFDWQPTNAESLWRASGTSHLFTFTGMRSTNAVIWKSMQFVSSKKCKIGVVQICIAHLLITAYLYRQFLPV